MPPCPARLRAGFGFATGTWPLVLRIPLARHAGLGLDERFQQRLLRAECAECEPDWVSAPFERLRELGPIAFDAAAG